MCFCHITYNVRTEMNGIHRIVVWTFVFHLSAQSHVSRMRHKLSKSDLSWDVTIETNVTNEIQQERSKTAAISFKWYTPEITGLCESMGICEDVPNYPEEHMKAMVQEARRLHPLRFDTNRLNDEPYQYSKDFKGLPEGLSAQNNNYQDLCRSETRIVIPRAAKNINNEWQFIVNTKDSPTQTFSVEVCTNPMASCSNVATFASNYDGWCQQKFIFINMMAINKHGDLIEDPHQIPSCCSCVYKDKYSFWR